MVVRRARSCSGLRSLPFSRKLSYFDGEFERLHRRRLLPASDSEWCQVVEPLLRCGSNPTHTRAGGGCGRARIALAAAGGVLLLGCLLLCSRPGSRFLSYCGRALLIQLLPYWDWTLYSNSDCLIRNPYYFERGLESLQLTDCINVCQRYPKVESLHKVDPKVVLQNYLRQNLPLIITDGAEEWVAQREFTVPFLTQLYSGHPALQNTEVCSYWDSHHSVENSPGSFLEKVHRQRLIQWAIQWKNCNKAAAKVIRSFYQRPYFLPPVVELAESNWLLMASRAENGAVADTFIKVRDHDGDLLMWIAQLQGVFEVQLLPKDICASRCTYYTLQLSPGETVAVPLQMWEVQYRPSSSIAIGLAATGNWLHDPRSSSSINLTTVFGRGLSQLESEPLYAFFCCSIYGSVN
ncbi:uncharacterized protein LOC121285453 [Carcharodon carcharias]|uniref:uncharacterized protein LOC121285453 n=1 Tax=Carcharodon carcharias TaxID=13397 RepID=UPI001B7F771C|nr:uncharacterized protein LOC121285453 [Carcharodon carcharias]